MIPGFILGSPRENQPRTAESPDSLLLITGELLTVELHGTQWQLGLLGIMSQVANVHKTVTSFINLILSVAVSAAYR